MATTRVGESYTRFVDAYDQIINDENEVDWKLGLKRWITATKKNESIFVEVNLCLESKKRRILQIFSVYFLLEGTKEKLVE